MKEVFIFLALLSYVKLSPLEPKASTCGYDSCPSIKPDMINVHLVCHTHNDIGWLKTIDEYYYGDKNDIQSAGVQYILDTVVEELQKNPIRRFIYVETSFFWRWWNNRDDTIHQQVQALVQSGQLEFVSGGWSMSDEAGNYYAELIDEHTTGFQFLNDTFGPCATPRVGWQIDPFGHSKETASLFAQFGYDGLFIGRLDYQDKTNRESTKTMEFMWNGSNNIGVNADLFTGVLPNQYFMPSGFCFDVTCPDEPIKDDPKLKDYNVDRRVDDFITQVNEQVQHYATNNIVMTMGSDFQYESAVTWFVNLDKVVKYVNARQANGSMINVFYSTPSCYVKALNQVNYTWTVKSDDFFPYGSDDHAYWTGYFTSRTGFKGYTKFTNNLLQVGKQMSVLSNMAAENEDGLNWLRKYQGDAQHHDAITGTSKQAVVDDYSQSLYRGVSLTQDAINNAYGSLLPLDASDVPEQQFCHFLNVSYCDATEKEDSFVVTIYNPLGQSSVGHIRFPVTSTSYTVQGPEGDDVISQIVPLPNQVLTDPEKLGTSQNDLVFQVDLQANGYSSYFVQKTAERSVQKSQLSKSTPKADDIIIQNEFLSVTVDGANGLLKSITDIAAQKTYNVQQNFLFYPAMAGDNHDSDSRASGAYIFRPNGTDAFPVTTTAEATLLTGVVVQEIQQTFSDYVSQVIRLYPGELGVEFEWFVGPVPVSDGIGKEVISRFTTDFVTEALFYTDANGREIQERRRDYRATWDAVISETISGNYYPVNSRIYIQDVAKDSQLTVVTDRSEGGSSIQDGDLELMLHRRLLYDDACGVAEPLNEPGVDGKGLRVRGKHRVFVSSLDAAAPLHRVAALRASYPQLPSFAPLAGTVEDYRLHFQTKFSGLSGDLPANVNLLTLEPWSAGTVLLRLEHFYEQNEDPTDLSLPVTVNLKNLFAGFEITRATETTLGANILLSGKNRLIWNTVTGQNQEIPVRKVSADPLEVSLNPMEIKTFVVTITYI